MELPDELPIDAPDALPDRTRKRVKTALCLSGGGYRAAVFHLGALRRLHETGLLARIDTVSSVSGGSILAGFLADCVARRDSSTGFEFGDWENDVAVPFRRFVGRDLRTAPIASHLLWNWLMPRYRVMHLERLYKQHLTDLPLSALPQRPHFIFCASDLIFGVNWVFTSSESGDYEVGYYAAAADWPIARAVTASACFPPVFGPMQVSVPANQAKRGRYRGADRSRLLSRLQLSDGGVYDNMALEPVWKDHAWVFVSDGGAPFEFEVGGHWLRRLQRYTSVVSNQARSLRKRMLYADLNEERYRGAYWSIASARARTAATPDCPGYPTSLIREVISRVRTDLDGFSDGEIKVLENHGYCEATRALCERVPDLIAAAPPAIMPHQDFRSDEAVREALKHSRGNFSLQRALARSRARVERRVRGS